MVAFKKRWDVVSVGGASNQTPAQFWEWRTVIHNAFLEAGMVQTNDTGQMQEGEYINKTPSTGNHVTVSGYSIYKIWENQEWLIKINWAINRSGTFIKPVFGFEVGISSDGAGEIIGNNKVVCKPPMNTYAGADNGTVGQVWKSLFYKSDKCLWIAESYNSWASGISNYSTRGFAHLSLNIDGIGNIVGDSITCFYDDWGAQISSWSVRPLVKATTMNSLTSGSLTNNTTPSWIPENIIDSVVVCRAVMNPANLMDVTTNHGIVNIRPEYFNELQEFLLEDASGSKKTYIAFIGDNCPIKMTANNTVKPAFIWD